MTYVPIKTVTVVNNRLHESTDLTQPVSSFLQTESYLIVNNNTFIYALPIGAMLNYLPNFDRSQQIGQAFPLIMQDVYVQHFRVGGIPLALPSGLYNNRLSVFNPFAYKDYTVHFTSVNTPTVIDDVTKKGFLDDLAISAPDHDLSQCLVAVNGVFHRTAFQNNVLYVLDGFRTMRLTGRKDVVVVDTRALGGHTIIPLTTSNVSQSAYQQPAYVSLSQSIAGKTVFAVIDGYFYHRDHDILSVADNTHLKIHTNKTPLIQQFRHNPRTLQRPDLSGDASQQSRKYTDNYAQLMMGKKLIDVDTLANSDFQYSRLTAYHSFLVVVNNPSVYSVSTDIVPTGTPQFYNEQSNRNISGMLNYGCGLCPSYLIWKDPSGRKSIFLPDQDYDVDRQNESIAPAFIPNLITDYKDGTLIPAKFIDYVSG